MNPDTQATLVFLLFCVGIISLGGFFSLIFYLPRLDKKLAAIERLLKNLAEKGL